MKNTKISKSTGKLFYLLLVVAMIFATAAISFSMTGCGEDPTPQPTPQEGIGVYYYDADGEVVTLSLNSGNKFTMEGQNINMSGEYSVNGTAITLDFTREEDGTATASIEGDTIVLTYNGNVMTFLKKVNYTVTFNTDGGSAIEAQSVLNGKYATKPADPKKDNHAFIGWYLDSALETPYDFTANAVKSDVTVYAGWVKKDLGRTEFTVNFDLGYDAAQAPEALTTINGKLYGVVAPEREGYTFAGWFISMYNDADKLTYAYTKDTTFDADTTLFAVWTDNSSTKLASPAVSVSANGVKWNAVYGASAYLVKIYSSSEVFFENTVGTTSYSFDFTLPRATDYIIEVTAIASNTADNSETAVRYYKGNLLGKVTTFAVANGVLTFNPVENAEKYLITIVCGNAAHEHTNIDNGTSTTYNFSACEMRPGGIMFTVTAVAEGYESSAPATYYYDYTDEALLEFVDLGNGTYGVRGKATADNANVTYIRIPAVHEGKLVTKILDSAFNGFNYLDAISIPDTVTTIGVEAFDGCSALTAYIVYKGTDEYEYTPVYSSYDGALIFSTLGGEVFLEAFPKAKTGTYTIAPGVTSILAYVFSGASIEKVIVSKDVTSIPENAFAGCITLKEVEFEGGRSVNVTISPTAFGESSNAYIKTLKLPALITPFENVNFLAALTNLETLEIEAGSEVYTTVNNILCNADPALTMLLFAPKKVVTTLTVDGVFTIPNGINGIGKSAFNGVYNASVKTVVIPEYVNLIAESAFEGASIEHIIFEGDRFDSLVIEAKAFKSVSSLKTVTFKESMQFSSMVTVTIGANAFESCSRLTTVSIGANTNIPSIGTRAFRSNSSLSTFSVDDTAVIKSIGSYAFENCRGLTSLTVHASTKTIGAYAYLNCTGLTSVAVAEGSTALAIGDYAFSKCTALKNVTLPDTVSAFNSSVFDGCDVTNMNIANGPAFYTDENGVIYNASRTELIYCPKTFGDLSKLAWDTLEKIGPSVFKGNTQIGAVEFGAKVIEIGANAFDGSSISSISFSPENKNALIIGNYAFNNCSKLTSVSLPASTISIGNYAFYNDKFTEITLPESLITIGDFAFGAVQIKSVTIPASVTYIGEKAFYLTGLSSVTVPTNSALETIGSYAFATTSITEFNMPSGVKYIGENAFYATGLKTVNIPATVTVIGANAFAYTPLETVNFANGTPDGSLEIGENVFVGTKLTAVTLPSQLKSIGGYNEELNYHTIEAVFPNTLASLNVMEGCTAYKTIDDVIYIIDGDNLILVYCPRAKTGEVLNIPTNVVLVEAKAFYGVQLSKITFAEYDKNDERYGKPTLEIGSFVNVVISTGVGAETYATIAQAPNLSYVHFPSHLKAMNSYAMSQMITGKDDAFLTIDFNVDCEEGVRFEYRALNAIHRTKSITLPKINYLGSYAIYSLGQNLQSITFTEGSNYTEIPDHAFASNTSAAFTSFTVPATVTSIGNNAFEGCRSLENLILEGDLVDTIGDKAFASTALRSFTFPTSVNAIGKGVFSQCEMLETITFSVNIEFIGNITSATETGIHNGCTSLIAFIVPEDNQYFKSVNGMLLSKDGTILYACPAKSTAAIPETVTTIKVSAFDRYEGKSIEIPSSVLYIEPGAFKYSSIESLRWEPEAPTEIMNFNMSSNADQGPFMYMSNLKILILGDNVSWLDEVDRDKTIRAQQIPSSFRATAEQNAIIAELAREFGISASKIRAALVRFKGYGYFTNVTTAEPTAEEIAFIEKTFRGNSAAIAKFIEMLAEYKQTKINEQLANDLTADEISGIEMFIKNYPDFGSHETAIKQAFINLKNSGLLDNVTDSALTREEQELINSFLQEAFQKDDKLISLYVPVLEEKFVALKQSIIDAQLNSKLTAEEIAGIEALVTNRDYKELMEKGAATLKQALINFKAQGFLNKVVNAEVTKEESEFISAFLNELFQKDADLVTKYTDIFTQKLTAYKQAIIDSASTEKVELTAEEIAGIEKLASSSEYFKGQDDLLKAKYLAFKTAYLVNFTEAGVSKAEIEFIDAFLKEALGEMYEKYGAKTLEDFTNRLTKYKSQLVSAWIAETLTREELDGIDKLVADTSKELGLSADVFQFALAQFKAQGFLNAPFSKELSAEEIAFINDFTAKNIKDPSLASAFAERFQQKLTEYKSQLISVWIAETLTREELDGIDKLVADTSKELGLSADVFQFALAQFKAQGFLNAPFSKELSAEEIAFINDFTAKNIKDPSLASAFAERFQQKLTEYKSKLVSAWIAETLTKDELEGIDKLVADTSKELGLSANVFQLALAQFKAQGFLNAPFSKELSAEEIAFINDFTAKNIKDPSLASAFSERFQQKLAEYKAILSKG